MFFALYFFFQAEDGIRDLYVTGVQTCALPISRESSPSPAPEATVKKMMLNAGFIERRSPGRACSTPDRGAGEAREAAFEERSEERRVGKECRARWSPDH